MLRITKVSGARKKTIRLLEHAVHLGLIAVTVHLLLVEVWIGAFFALLWYLLSNVIPVAVLAPFFGPDRVKEALWGDIALPPPKREPAPGARAEMIGSVGNASTELDPEGHVTIDGRPYWARSDGRVIPARTQIIVVDTRLGMLIVMPKEVIREA